MGIRTVPDGAEGWHEDHLMVEVLRSGPKPMARVWEAVHSMQSAKMGKMGSPPHCKSNFKHRIKYLIESGVLNRVGEDLVLTNVGKWVANSSLLDQDGRMAFLDVWVCRACTQVVGQVVLQIPILQTAKKISGRLRLDAICPNCRQIRKYLNQSRRRTDIRINLRA
jgi:hypothetical protein